MLTAKSPMAFITPAKSHPEVIPYSVAARDKSRATAYARKYGIPVVKDSYDDIINDPEIHAVYIPLPNGLHFEWAMKALAKGKHVLLEKPSTSNAHEADILFHSPTLGSSSNPPILMEAFHSRMTPAMKLFLSLLDKPNITHAKANLILPAVIAKDDDIRFNYSLAGGALMDAGTYPVGVVLLAFGTEPTECIESNMTPMAPPREQCDATTHAKLRFPNGGIGEIDTTLRGSNFRIQFPNISVTHKAVPAPEEAKEGMQVTRTRKVFLCNFVMPHFYHYIEIEDEFEETTVATKAVRKWTKKEIRKAYTFKEAGEDDLPSEIYWTTYRHMLEQFVNQVRGRKGNGAVITHEESLIRARTLDMIYNKSSLGARLASEYCKTLDAQK